MRKPGSQDYNILLCTYLLVFISLYTHTGQTLRFYCRDCETAVCSSCTDIEHRTHNTLHLADAVDEHRAAMHQLIERVTMQVNDP